MSDTPFGADSSGDIAPKPIPMKEGLEKVYDPRFSTLGHGTSLEKAQEILRDGLFAAQPSLLSTAVPLFDQSAPLEEQVDSVIGRINNWVHYDKKNAVMVLMLPNPGTDQPGGSEYFNSVFGNKAKDDLLKYRIPPKYIKGFFDVDSGTFVENPMFTTSPIEAKAPQTPDMNSQAQVPIPTAASPEGADVW
jgi:hypothetical protein